MNTTVHYVLTAQEGVLRLELCLRSLLKLPLISAADVSIFCEPRSGMERAAFQSLALDYPGVELWVSEGFELPLLRACDAKAGLILLSQWAVPRRGLCPSTWPVAPPLDRALRLSDLPDPIPACGALWVPTAQLRARIPSPCAVAGLWQAAAELPEATLPGFIPPVDVRSETAVQGISLSEELALASFLSGRRALLSAPPACGSGAGPLEVALAQVPRGEIPRAPLPLL